MVILVYADFYDNIFCQKFLTEIDMNKFIEQDNFIIIGNKILQ